MTKIGGGKDPNPSVTVQQHRKELDKSINKFQIALSGYKESDTKKKEELKGIMDQSLALISTSLAGLKDKGIHTPKEQIEKDYQNFIEDDSSKNLST